MGVKVRMFEGSWYIFINHKNRRKAKKIGVGPEAKRRADEAAKMLQSKLALGDLGMVEPQVVTFAQYAEEWLEGYVAINLKRGSQDFYSRVMHNHWIPGLGGTPILEISRTQIRTIIAQKTKAGMQASTARTILSVLQSCLSIAQQEEVISRNPLQKYSKWLLRNDPQRSKADVFFTEPELKHLLDTAKQFDPRAYALVMLLARTGLRIGEATALQVGDLDFDSREIWVRRTWGSRKKTEAGGQFNSPKSGRERRVDMSLQLMLVLKSYLGMRSQPSNPWLFYGKDGTALRPSSFTESLWQPLFASGLIRYRKPHALRHTYASLLIFRGESLAYIRDQLGHSSIKITVDTYGHLIPSASKRVVDGLDDPEIRKQSASSSHRKAQKLALVGLS